MAWAVAILAVQFEIGIESIAGIAAVAVIVGAVVALVIDKRRRDLVELYKGLYEAKNIENRDQQKRIDRLEARIEFFESSFTKSLAEGVVEAIMRIMDERYPKGGQQ